ncbi:uncharacterized protein LOC126378350 isoform X2 [Pectinophora gossypiella]|uniref:uncharacterized protein LOC126378350 isoform X2 n=1 Tax=Pectinophora gossypiella TaxID=13191 RepID=UPI00214F33ED|nr:uncharacterized protein LOC126378350 isoform X2 [Pectinophora gossypiella]
MDRQKEYHDPDYPEASVGAEEVVASTSEEDKIDKIRRIIRREFSTELETRENEVMLIDQRALMARRMLHRLRYVLVNNYYNEERLKLSSGQVQDEVAAQSEPRARAAVSGVLRDNQRRLHPSVRKLLGKQSSTVELHEILFRRRAPRNKTRKDYSAMVQSRNYTIAADTTKSLRPASPEPEPRRPKKVPRRMEPKITNVLSVADPTRNQTKYRYRIIIGNTSKYAPPASSADRSTHKWLLYVRGPPDQPDLSAVVSAVTVRLHHSYAPHHTVHIDKPPFHISRRGWGEFPARVELHFPLPERNRPASIEHTIKLDRNYTGFQTLGAETVVDVWLYSTEDMLKYEFKEDNTVENIKEEPTDLEPQTDAEPSEEPIENQFENSIFGNSINDSDKQADNWLDFFSNTTELDVDEMIIKPQKKPEEINIENVIETNIIQKENPVQNHVEPVVKQEIDTEETEQNTHWNDGTNVNVKKESGDIPNELLTQSTSPKKRIMKYMDPTTGKIYYLEMDRKLDLSKVQEIVINSKGNVKTAKISPIKPNGMRNVKKNTKKGGVSLLKPEIKSLLKNETSKVQKKTVLRKNYTHIENDHCYLGPQTYREAIPQNVYTVDVPYSEEVSISVKQEKSVYESVCAALLRFCNMKVAVDYCLRNIPLISKEARDPDFLKCFPFCVETEEKYWKLDFAKRRNIEWSRAKLINKLCTEHLTTTETIWRTKQILIYSRLHGYHPVRPDTTNKPTTTDTDWSSWTDLENLRKTDSNIREIFPNATDITTLTRFNSEEFSQNLSESLDLTESDEEIEIVKWEEAATVKKEVLPDSSSDLQVLPVQDAQERLRYLFLERKCADIGIELRNEDVGNGYSCSSSTERTLIRLEDVYRAAGDNPRLHALTSRCLAVPRTHHYAI